jgi:hypothetical protein
MSIKLNTFSMLPFAKGLLGYLDLALSAGFELQEDGVSIDEGAFYELLAKEVVDKMKDWKPTINGIEIMDDDTKSAAAAFLSRITLALLKGKE